MSNSTEHKTRIPACTLKQLMTVVQDTIGNANQCQALRRQSQLLSPRYQSESRVPSSVAARYREITLQLFISSYTSPTCRAMCYPESGGAKDLVLPSMFHVTISDHMNAITDSELRWFSNVPRLTGLGLYTILFILVSIIFSSHIRHIIVNRCL